MTKHERRTPEQLVAELEARIVGVKARAERKRARAHPAVRQAIVAVKALDKALAATSDAMMRKAFQEARMTVDAVVALDGVKLPAAGTVRSTLKKRKATAAVA